MALGMDEGVRHVHGHHRTALPKRTSPPEAKTALMRKGLVSSNQFPVAAPRRKGEIARRNKEPVLPASSPALAAAVVAVCAGGGGGGAGAKGGGASGGSAANGANVARHNSKKSRIGGSAGGEAGAGNRGERGGSYGVIGRKRVRVVDEKLGEFVVFLTRYDGDHNDVCERCDRGGDLLCCDFCNLVYHLTCVTPKLTELPHEELWLCPACMAEVKNRQTSKRRRMEDSGRTSPGPGSGRGQGENQNQNQDRLASFHGVKPENEAFRAFVLYKNQTLDIGLYPTAQAAARAYDRKALSLFGDAAVCNFPADEQVEVEGVGADGMTVKGVVRSFHQWRAEMQWGNKKRHLGFFDGLDHAAFAYNRAALYMNGPETALNPTKEGYVPPPLTGAPVRVPRNKVFAQQLPLPLSARAQVTRAGQSAEQQRRRYQMQGKYHAPLVGEGHQVSYLPPLPPPSRPWAGGSIMGHSTTKAPEGSLAAPSTSISDAAVVDRVQLPARPAARVDEKTSAAAGEAAPRVSEAKTGELSAREAKEGGDAGAPSLLAPTACCGSPSVAKPSPSTGVYEAGLAEEQTVRRGCGTARPSAVTAAMKMDNCLTRSTRPNDIVQLVVNPNSDDRANTNANEAGARNGKALPTTPERGSPRGKGAVASGDVANGGSKAVQAALEKPTPSPVPVPTFSRLAQVRDAAEKATVEVARRVVLSFPAAEAQTMYRSTSVSDVTAQSPNGHGNDKAATFPQIFPLSAEEGGASQWSNEGTPQRKRTCLEPTSGKCFPPCTQASFNRHDNPAPVQETGGFLQVQRKAACATVSEPTGIPTAAARKLSSNLPPQPSGYDNTIDVALLVEKSLPPVSPYACSKSTMGKKDGDEGFSRDGVGNFYVVAPPTSDGPPPPNLAFEDVAELVWDPRSGPKPKGAGEGKTGEKAKLAVERAMWERDSTLLGRVAPAHTERALQVLQTCRHDVERAAQMLSVRHGLHVIGLSSVRKTRNSHAEQQALDAAGWRGSGSDPGGGSGGWSGDTCNVAATPGGWQPAMTASCPRSASKRADAQGVSHEEARLAGEAFKRHGRDLDAVAKALGWKKNRVVDYYYCVWKYSPAYQVWKATRHQAGVPGVGTGTVSGGTPSGSSSGGPVSGGLAKASSDGMRWRGSRLRTLKASSLSEGKITR